MRRKNSKVILVIALIITIVGLSIGFAMFQVSLTINGIVGVDGKSKWEVKFLPDTLKIIANGDGRSVVDPVFDEGATSFGNAVAALYKPGDAVIYTFDVKNFGTIDAGISFNSVEKNITCTLPSFCDNNLTFSLTYKTGNYVGEEVKSGDILPAGETVTLQVKFEYNLDSEELPEQSVTMTVNDIYIDYVQAS